MSNPSITDTTWYEKAPPGSPDNYVTTRMVTQRWANPPKWIYAIISAKTPFLCKTFSLGADPDAIEPTLVMRMFAGIFFDVSVIGGNSKTLPAALPHDSLYAMVKELAAYYGQSIRTILHIADHWFLATMRMTGWTFSRSYFAAVRMFGYQFNRLGQKNKDVKNG